MNLPASVLFLSAAASRRFLVDEGIRMGGRMGGGQERGGQERGGLLPRGVQVARGLPGCGVHCSGWGCHGWASAPVGGLGGVVGGGAWGRQHQFQ